MWRSATDKKLHAVKPVAEEMIIVFMC